MQILGQSLQKYFATHNKKLSLSEIKDIGIQALNILESVHNSGIVHGDIKPSSFYLGINETSKIYLTDFGLAFEFNNNFEGRKGVYSFEDLKFCSKNCCQNYQKSRRDDIESLGYILVYLLKGFLPWEYSNNDINIKQKKLSTSLNDLCSGLYFNIKKFIRYSWNLKFDEKPNYNYLRDLLRNLDRIYPIKKAFSKEFFKQISPKEFNLELYKSNRFISYKELKMIEMNYIQNKNSKVFNNKLRMFGKFSLNKEETK